ncbi:fido domain-containing protein [Cercophora scortea]|uniref:Fido domain-containing protein n=1 Tax=Cercophora scortea TaxID=314031 RepID=A0AAE0M9Q8_9PEZI|nr:fido domain-containing protein [Cercophora scortea]
MSFTRTAPRLAPCHHLTRSLHVGASTLAAQRTLLLKRIYAPFEGLKKGSPEYEKLAISGRVWEDYFQPGNSERYRYDRMQKMFEPVLEEIEGLNSSIKLPERRTIVESLVAEYAQQSVKIENNTLRLGDSIILNDHLVSTFLKQRDLGSMPALELSNTGLPNLQFLLPEANPSQLAELRNHIIACHWVASKAMLSLNTPKGIDENEVKSLSALIVKDTDSEGIYSAGWGKRIKPGDYRQTPISVKSNPLRIFPYHDEVPALMNRFFEWKNSKEGALHPLILACQATAYFVYVHPFPDGNGRVSRLVFQDALMRRGYLPVALRGVGRDEYLRMIVEAQDGDPSRFVKEVLSSQLEALRALRSRGSGKGN